MSTDLGILILRVVIGGLFIGHGSQKAFGWFNGPGPQGFAGFVGSMGLRPVGFWAAMGTITELVGGILLVLGLLNPLGPLAIVSSMLMAIAKAHWPKVWATEGGMEYPLVNIAAVTTIALAAGGLYSLDARLGTGLHMPEAFIIGFGLVFAGLVVGLGTAQRASKGEAHEPEAEDEEEKLRLAA